MSASFDRVVIVDWSANSSPKSGKDSIWAAEAIVDTAALRSVNIRTRWDAIDLLHQVVAEPGRVLIGVDFSLGFPRGTAAALGLSRPSWRSMWRCLAAMIVDDERNLNNRFAVAAELNERIGTDAGPFWGCPPSRANDFLTSTKRPCDPLPDWRTVESVLRSRNLRPFSAWQLMGAGAVGSQSLLGIAAMARFVDAVGATSRSIDVWPFTTGFAVPSADVVLAEIWPSLVPLPEASRDRAERRVRDQLQVEALATEFARRDLAEVFTPSVTAMSLDSVIDEEGWILGVT